MYWETAISTQIDTHGHFKVFNEQNESLEPSSTDSSQVSWNNCPLFRISYPAAIGRARQAQQGATGLALLEEGRGEAMLPVHKTLPRLHAQLRRETAPPQGDTGTAFFKYFLKVFTHSRLTAVFACSKAASYPSLTALSSRRQTPGMKNVRTPRFNASIYPLSFIVQVIWLSADQWPLMSSL